MELAQLPFITSRRSSASVCMPLDAGLAGASKNASREPKRGTWQRLSSLLKALASGSVKDAFLRSQNISKRHLWRARRESGIAKAIVCRLPPPDQDLTPLKKVLMIATSLSPWRARVHKAPVGRTWHPAHGHMPPGLWSALVAQNPQVRVQDQVQLPKL